MLLFLKMKLLITKKLLYSHNLDLLLIKSTNNVISVTGAQRNLCMGMYISQVTKPYLFTTIVLIKK